ncbi:hypothetical protein B0H65DRAFT_455097 [Neurospora tetraspora]|uniref:Uncharacterized protein n=1 Tax=Neurospora tetraspora TaxID=94610 RepID=A0AAE0JJ24_9PEZI|nr:hypothetical protein B0H65DRAFT_455097 [Neurospora tetraspora]
MASLRFISLLRCLVRTNGKRTKQFKTTSPALKSFIFQENLDHEHYHSSYIKRILLHKVKICNFFFTSLGCLLDPPNGDKKGSTCRVDCRYRCVFGQGSSKLPHQHYLRF